MKNKIKKHRRKSNTMFSWRNISIILLLLIFFPVGIPMMWKFTNWSKRTKWMVTGVVAALVVIGTVGAYYAKPDITVTDSQDGKVSTNDSAYVLSGHLRSKRGAITLTVNNHPVPVNNKFEFSHQVLLVEGDNLMTLKAANANGSSEEVIIIHRTTSAELAQRDAEEAARVRLEADKKDQANLDTQSRAKQVQEEAAAKSAARSADTSCNWWCRLTGGNKTQPQNEATKKESANQVAEPSQPYKQFGSFIPHGSSSVNIQNWAYAGSEVPSESQVKNDMKDIFDKQCGEGTSWGTCDILLWDKKYNVNTSVYNDTCVDEGGYRTQLIGYIKGTSGFGQFFYKCVSGNVTLSKDSRGLVVTNSIDGKAKYTTSYYIDSGYTNEPAY